MTIHSAKVHHLVHKNVYKLASEVGRLTNSTQRYTAPKDILQEFADLAKEENDNPFILQNVFHLIHKNVSRLASEVGRLIYNTQRHSQEFADLSEEKMTIHSLCKRSSPSP